MRLKSIKLAGFKSFVDPTKVELLSNRVAIVGPNGCGKSNIIDAVRWVMGESSAKQLRGESLVDVIFNGSTHRPPISQASIELHFDNSDGTLGGEYASYSEIVVRRQVTRDGQSVYALNGSRCRRKDITDIFLGTGLGPRSYAIIEQGTISRLIEAKPDELRLFLEEAAGISKYKERRRETELRLSHTRDNLARLSDIRDELAKQIAHLDRQAKAAERFKLLKEEERTVKAQLLALRSRLLQSELVATQQQIALEQDHLLGLQTQVAILEAGNSDRLDQQETAQNALNQIQQHYMEQGALVARLEQNIQHAEARHQHIQQDLQALNLQLEQSMTLQTRDAARLSQLNAESMALEPAFNDQTLALELMGEQLAVAEQNAEQVQATWDSLNVKLVKASQIAQQKQHELQKLEQQHQHLLQQQQRLNDEQKQVQLTLADIDPNDTDSELEQLQQQQTSAHSALSECQSAIELLRLDLSQARAEMTQWQSQLTAQKAQLTALETYQAQALKRSTRFPLDNLKTLGLENAKALIDLLDVEPGYEQAIETILGSWLQALCVETLPALFDKLTGPQKHPLSLVELNTVHSKTPRAFAHGIALATKVKGPSAIINLLTDVYLIDAVNAHYAELDTHITLITKDGLLLKAGLLQLGQVATDSVLERLRQIQTISLQIQTSSEQGAIQQDHVDEREQQLILLEQSQRERQLAWQHISQRCHQQQSVVQIRSAKRQQLQDRLQAIHQQIEQAILETNQLWVSHEDLREVWQSALSELDALNQQRDHALHMRDSERDQLQQCRTRWQALQQQVHQLKLQQQRLSTEKHALENQGQRTLEQLNQLTARQTTLTQADTEALEPLPLWLLQVEEVLNCRFEQEQTLQSAKIQVQTLAESFRHSELQRREIEQQVETQRTALENARLTAEALQARWQSVQEQIIAAEWDPQTLDAALTDDTSESVLQSQLDDSTLKIQRLGLVNLAAIEEFETQSARKTYLDEQNQDLVEAMTTLENAIRTIDRETKNRFSATFEQVNQNFQALFPEVFAGGKAYLELTGDDLLSTGVMVFAQPPGKRNSTIHLLSGGEKALTAVALVFAIFQINPAPFCMLDEVDAPLDDTNVSRFCHLVNKMAEKTQFIMVTHNKVAMEMAEHLMGVTMQEPGVSRLVTVDMNAALAMVDA